MSVTAVITNCALIAMSPQVQQYVPTYGGVTVVVAVVIAEVWDSQWTSLIELQKYVLLIPTSYCGS